MDFIINSSFLFFYFLIFSEINGCFDIYFSDILILGSFSNNPLIKDWALMLTYFGKFTSS